MTTFNRSTRDGTTFAMKKQPDEEILDYFLESASTVKTLEAVAVSVHSRYCSTGVNHESTPGLKQWWSDTRQLEEPASGAAAAKGKFMGKVQCTSGDCVRRV